MSDSIKKVPFLSARLFEKITKMNLSGNKSIIFTWSRSSTVLPVMVGHTIAVYNGREHIPILISNQMIGEKLGEFVQTRTFKGHIKADKKTKR
uniref:Small ribosomal subunit protein uS19c n=1 Tax=Lepocinclis playfairiana TaxID=1403386 RepID=A0A3G3LLI3_9EUGL|nr:ribosomal protein S19 [Lepocinclis playfairiana]AYQ93567.1 ribosomal protein S19 [Lepocinclis playfairiana]